VTKPLERIFCVQGKNSIRKKATTSHIKIFNLFLFSFFGRVISKLLAPLKELESLMVFFEIFNIAD
jgi:hypothetical protein